MILTLRITDEQQERWRGKAEGEGMSLSDWVRRACESAANGGGGASLPPKQVQEVKRKLEEFNKVPGPGAGAGDESGQDTPRIEEPKSEAPRSVPVSSTGPGKVTTISSRHRPPEKERKPKKVKETGNCPHGFMVVEGTTACPRCSQ